MRPRLSTITTSVSLFVVSAAASTLIEQLPGCWQTCIEKRGPQCDDSDLDCLCHFAATTTLFFPSLLPCVRRSCDSEFYAQFLTAPLRTMQTACAGTRYSISDIAVSKAVHATESAYSADVDAGREGGRSATRTRGTKSWHLNPSSTTRGVSIRPAVSSTDDGRASSTTVSASVEGSVSPTTRIPTVSTIPPKRVSISTAATSTAQELASSTTTSTSASSSVSSIGPPTGAPILSTPAITSQQSSASSKSTSAAHVSNEGGGGGGGTPLDVGQQGVGVEKWGGSLLGSSLLGLLAIAFVPMVFF